MACVYVTIQFLTCLTFFMRPPFNLRAVNAATDVALASGHRVLQTHRFAPTDLEQVKYLLDLINPVEGGIVLDAGCGVGEVSKIMSQLRPDLKFILLNISEYQLSHCPTGPQFMHVVSDCHSMNLPDECVDAIMYSSTLCQLDTEVALKEAYRVLKIGGVLFINDMIRTGGDGKALEELLAARVLDLSDLEDYLTNFVISMFFTPAVTTDFLKDLLATDGHEGLMDNVHPVVVVAYKK